MIHWKAFITDDYVIITVLLVGKISETAGNLMENDLMYIATFSIGKGLSYTNLLSLNVE